MLLGYMYLLNVLLFNDGISGLLLSSVAGVQIGFEQKDTKVTKGEPVQSGG